MSGKYALIIGNTEYTDPGLTQLTAPAKDVEDFERVLKEPEICAFDSVITLINQPSSTVIAAIDEFYDQKKYDDLLVLYFSGHGIKDEFGSLYLAFKDTIATRLRRTAIKSADISEVMDQSRSRRQVLILDCCNSGAFPEGAKAEIGGTMGLIKAFQGKGRFVLTASNAIQYAYEGRPVIGETENSLFTHFLVKGLRGEADSNGDGSITVDELYDYAFNEISKITPKQTPTKSSTKQEGDIFLRENIPMIDIKPVPLPPYIIAAIESPEVDIRLGAVRSLTIRLNGKNLGLARSAKEELERIEREDDSRLVSQAATQVLEPIRQAEKAEEEKKATEEAERISAQKIDEERIALEKADREAKAEAERRAKDEAERLIAEQKAEKERTAKEEANRLAKQKAEQERLGRENAEADRRAKQVAEKSTREKAAREATDREVARLKAEREAMETATREAAAKADQEEMELAARRSEEREAKEKIDVKERKVIRPSWMKFGVVGGLTITLCLCGYGITRVLPALFVIVTPTEEAALTERPATNAATTLTAAPIVTSTLTEPISTLTNTPQKTSTPQAQRFFTEEFNTPLSDDWSVLTVTGSVAADVDKVNVEARNGKLVWNFDSEYVYYYLFYDVFRYTDVKVDVRADNLGRNNNNISLICRYDPEVGWYEFNIANNGLYDIYFAAVASNGDISYSRIANGGSNAIKQGQEVNDYSISCKGDQLSLTINGQEVTTIAERTYSLGDGHIGISVSSFNVLPILIEMDWVKISEP